LVIKSFHQIGPAAQDLMGVISHDRKSNAIDRKYRSQMFQPIVSPLTPVFEVLSGRLVHSTEKSPSDATVPDMDDLNFRRINRRLASLPSHDRSLLKATIPILESQT
jgi:hypothetical protein